MKRKLAHVIGAAFVMALLAAVFSMGASAQTLDGVMYLDENGEEQYAASATVVESLPGDVEDQNVTWTGGWYVVPADKTVSIYGNITMENDVHLILQGRPVSELEEKIDKSILEIQGSILGDGHLYVYGQGGGDGPGGWQTWSLGELRCNTGIYVDTTIYGGVVGGPFGIYPRPTLTVDGGYFNIGDQDLNQDLLCDVFTISSGYAAGNLQCSKATVSGGTVEGKISSGEVEITGGTVTVNSSVYGPYVIESTGDIKISGGEVNGHVHSVGNIEINSENGNPEINGHVESDGDITISDGQVNGSVNANGYNYNSGTVTITGGTVTDVNGVMVHVTDATLGSAYASDTLNIRGKTVIDGDVSAGSTVNMYSGTIGGVYMLGSDMSSLTVNITGGTVTGDVDGSVICVGDQDGKTEPVIRGSIPNTRASSEHSVTVYSGTIEGDIDTPFFTMEGGKVQGNVQVGSNGGWMDAGACSSLTLQQSYIINGGTIQQLYTSGSVVVNAGTIGTFTGGGGHAVVYDNTAGEALPENFVPKQMLYLSFDKVNKRVTGFADGNLSFPEDFSITAPSEWGDQAQMEVTILPGATVTVPWMIYKGTLLVEGEFLGRDGDRPVVYGTTPYYAINADAETVSGVSAAGAIVRDGVTFAQPDTLVTLTPKESGAVRWAVEPAALTVQSNKFYMPDEVVDIKASKLPLEPTPKLGIDSKGENLTGLTVGAYYSISDAIFRPSKTTLPIRPEWYGTTVTIIKLGDGFATADSFAQSLAIPAKSSGGGTVAPTPTPGGDDSGWEQVEEEIADAKPGATVTVEDSDIPGEVLEALAGEDVTLRVKVNSSLSWEIKGGDLKISASYSDLDLAVTWKSQGIPADLLSPLLGRETVQFSVKHDGEFGFPATLVTDLGRANAGRWANLYHYNEKDGAIEFEAAVQIGGEGKARLPMSHASQYAVVIGEKSHQLPFTDIPNSWYTEAVRYVYTHNMMAGTSGTTFVPTKSLTRAEVAQVLYNIEDQPEVNGTTSFADSAAHWAKTPIAWAEQTGVVDGYEDGTFRPGQPVTRQEFAQMLHNYAAYKGYDLTAKGDLSRFPDGSQVQDWALPAMSWANGNALINGHDDGILEPGGTTTRAQAASILMRFDQKLVEE